MKQWRLKDKSVWTRRSPPFSEKLRLSLSPELGERSVIEAPEFLGHGYLESEAELHFDAPIVPAFGEGTEATRDGIGLTE